MNTESLKHLFAKLRPNATFASIKEYRNNYNEVSNFGIVFHIDYLTSLKRSFDIVSKYDAADSLHKDAKRLVLASMSKRIEFLDKNKLEENDFPYVYFKDATGALIKGIKAHQDTNNLYMFGTLVSKEVITPGFYPTVHSSPLTLAKNRIEKLTPISRFRQFKLQPKSYKEIKIENLFLR